MSFLNIETVKNLGDNKPDTACLNNDLEQIIGKDPRDVA